MKSFEKSRRLIDEASRYLPAAVVQNSNFSAGDGSLTAGF